MTDEKIIELLFARDERALAAITESDPRGVNDEVLGEIFSKFCVGK